MGQSLPDAGLGRGARALLLADLWGAPRELQDVPQRCREPKQDYLQLVHVDGQRDDRRSPRAFCDFHLRLSLSYDMPAWVPRSTLGPGYPRPTVRSESAAHLTTGTLTSISPAPSTEAPPNTAASGNSSNLIRMVSMPASRAT